MQGTPQFYGFKNRIINGTMTIDQRNAGASGTAINTYTLDRFAYFAAQTGKLTYQQNAGSVTPPVGFANYLGFTSSSAYSVTSTDYFTIQQAIEGYNVADLGWGTANAKTVTLSFQVRSSLTGTFGGSIANSAANRCYPFSYTISSANTWTTISITIVGDTTGTWLTTNGVGMYVVFGLGQGSTTSGTAGAWGSTYYSNATGATSVVGTNGATFYITGVQLEVGVSATTFDFRSIGTELQLCQRYYQQIGGPSYVAVGFGINFSGDQIARGVYIKYTTTMREVPSASIVGTLIVTDRTGFDTDVSGIAAASLGVDSGAFSLSKATVSGSNNTPVQIAVKNGTTSYIAFSAEL
jgi:hypothetical protein